MLREASKRSLAREPHIAGVHSPGEASKEKCFMGITNVKSLPGRSRTIRHARTVALASISLTLGLAACGSSGGNSAAGTGSKNITVGMASVLSGPDSDL